MVHQTSLSKYTCPGYEASWGDVYTREGGRGGGANVDCWLSNVH